jgi:hypothetical protein
VNPDAFSETFTDRECGKDRILRAKQAPAERALNVESSRDMDEEK